MKLSACIIIVSTVIASVKAYPSSEFMKRWNTGLTYPCGDDVKDWVADIKIGTPGQSFPLLLDTSTPSSWVAGIMCHSDFCTTRKGPLFDAGKSSTIQNEHIKVTLDYEEGTVVGDLYNDDFIIGDRTLKNYTFGKAFEVDGFDNSVAYAGIWGLGGTDDTIAKRGLFEKRNSDVGIPYSNKVVAGDFNKRNNVGRTCKFEFGVDESSIDGEIAWLDFPTCDYGDSPYWKAKLTCAKIGDAVDLKFDKTVASFDTSVKNIQVPHKDIAVIHQGLGAKYNDNSKQYEFKCCDAKELTFSFENYDITLPLEAWTRKVDEETCTDIFEVLEPKFPGDENTWKLGTRFIVNFYSIFDMNKRQTGFALIAGGANNGLKLTPK